MCSNFGGFRCRPPLIKGEWPFEGRNLIGIWSCSSGIRDNIRLKHVYSTISKTLKLIVRSGADHAALFLIWIAHSRVLVSSSQ